MKRSLSYFLVLIVVSCAPSTDPEYNRTPLTGGGNKDGRFEAISSVLSPSHLGMKVVNGAIPRIENEECIEKSGTEPIDFVRRLARETISVELFDADKASLVNKISQLFPMYNSQGLDFPKIWKFTDSAQRQVRLKDITTVTIYGKRTNGFEVVNEKAKAGCDNYVKRINGGAMLMVAFKIHFSKTYKPAVAGRPRVSYKDDFGRRYGYPFYPGLDSRRDKEMSRALKDGGAKIYVYAIQFGGDPTLINRLASGTHCSVDDLQACREVRKKLIESFDKATANAPTREEHLAQGRPFQIIGYVSAKPTGIVVVPPVRPNPMPPMPEGEDMGEPMMPPAGDDDDRIMDDSEFLDVD